ncbi:MAG: hypothetical protein GF364_16870 [Candidatus Lokiarchaeota archaeon]|nr:hypothetical protein [Candidatus Lokiarchaeota archaeon]
MGILDLTFPRNEFKGLDDYEKIINHILKLDVPFTILKFNLNESGIAVKLDVPTEKVSQVTQTLEKAGIKIKRQVIEIDEELCIDCGQCIALCNTGALCFDEDSKLKFCEDKCVGCHLCVDACPRQAIKY